MPKTDLGWIARSMLHGEGWGCALRIEAHFDESGTTGSELTLAGYLFEADRIDQFSLDWDRLLQANEIPFLHMVDFAPGNPPFDKIENRSKVQMQFMRLIKRHSINGVVCNIPNIVDNMGSSYLSGVRGAVGAVLEWADGVAYDGKIAYFFEAGATGQGLADGHFQQIASDPASSARHRYAGHAFLPKERNAGVQAADFLAWQYHNYTKKRAKADLARLDMRALLRHPHHVVDQCGAPPRASKIQSVAESRNRIETIHYLPIAPHGEWPEIVAGKDFTVFSGETPGSILACSNCFRAIAEDCRPNQFSGVVVRCWCGTKCLIPPLLAPFSRREPLLRNRERLPRA